MTPQPRIQVDPDRCVGNAMCLALAPGVFEHDEHRQSRVTDPEGEPLATILEAANNCPTAAISVWDARGTRLFPDP